MKHVRFFIFLIFIFTVFFNCDHGLSPSDAEIVTGIRGVITYADNWPPPDSLKELRLVAFQDFPPGNIFAEIVSGRAIAFPSDPDENASLDFNVHRQEYFMEMPVGTYKYIVVAHRFGSNRFSQDSWRAVGQYDTDSDSLPTQVTLEENTILLNININVDFKHLPIQPF